MNEEVRKFLSDIGRKGGLATAKKYDMKAISKKGVEARRKKREKTHGR